MSDGSDHASNAISHLKNAEAELDASSLSSAGGLSNLVGLIRRFVEADREGELEAMRAIFDQFDNL